MTGSFGAGGCSTSPADFDVFAGGTGLPLFRTMSGLGLPSADAGAPRTCRASLACLASDGCLFFQSAAGGFCFPVSFLCAGDETAASAGAG